MKKITILTIFLYCICCLITIIFIIYVISIKTVRDDGYLPKDFGNINYKINDDANPFFIVSGNVSKIDANIVTLKEVKYYALEENVFTIDSYKKVDKTLQDETKELFEISLKNENAYVTYYKRESLFKILKQIKKIDLEYYTMYLPTAEEIEIYYPYIENLKEGDKLHTSLFNGLDLTNGEYNPNLMLICNNFKLCNSRRVYNFDEKLYKELEFS